MSLCSLWVQLLLEGGLYGPMWNTLMTKKKFSGPPIPLTEFSGSPNEYVEPIESKWGINSVKLSSWIARIYALLQIQARIVSSNLAYIICLNGRCHI